MFKSRSRSRSKTVQEKPGIEFHFCWYEKCHKHFQTHQGTKGFIARSGEFIRKALALPGPAPPAAIARESNNVPDRRICGPSLPKPPFHSSDPPVPHPALTSASGNCPLLYSQRHGNRPDRRKYGKYDGLWKTVYKNRGFLYIIPEKWFPERQSGALKSPDSYVRMQASRSGYNPTFMATTSGRQALPLVGVQDRSPAYPRQLLSASQTSFPPTFNHCNIAIYDLIHSRRRSFNYSGPVPHFCEL
jgi:hypothetical protein